MAWFNFIDLSPTQIGLISKLPLTTPAQEVLLDEVKRRSDEIGASVTGYRVVMDGIGATTLIPVCGFVRA